VLQVELKEDKGLY